MKLNISHASVMFRREVFGEVIGKIHSFWVVPINGQYAVLASRWVNDDGVMLSECIYEVGGVIVGQEFDARVV